MWSQGVWKAHALNICSLIVSYVEFLYHGSEYLMQPPQALDQPSDLLNVSP